MPRKKHDREGRPSMWETPEKLQDDINRYYKHCDECNKPYTIAGMASYLNVDRKTIYNYSYKDEFIHIIKKAREKILASLEEKAITNGNAGTIFILKQYGYNDRQEIVSENVNVNKNIDLTQLSVEEIKKILNEDDQKDE